jgi:hypothetical protein
VGSLTIFSRTTRPILTSLIEFGQLVLEKIIIIKKKFSVFLLFCYYLPLQNGYPLRLNKRESPSPKDDLFQVWLKLAQWLWRRWFLNDPIPFLRFLAHLSWKLKWAILIARCPSSVCPSVRLSVNFYIFDFSKTTWPISTKLGTNHPWGEGILNCSNEGDCPSPRGDNHKRVKIN